MPMVLLDIVERKFVFFGTVFRPTETLLFGVMFLAVFMTIFLLTAIFGRVWCGWACPQTVSMEFVYRPIERFFLGKAYANPKAGVSAWRRVAMYAVYLVDSAHLANTMLAWLVGADRLTG
ncbi:MAG: 4Fe-4S binding protein, partial [bacterium]